MTSRRRVFSVLVTALVLSMLGSAPANASEIIGTRVDGPNGSCADGFVANSHVKVCFEPYGEKLYVKDGEADGRSAYGVTSFSTTPCRNKFGVGTWVVCDYAMPEGWHITYVGYTQDNEGIFNPQRDLTGEASDIA